MIMRDDEQISWKKKNSNKLGLLLNKEFAPRGAFFFFWELTE